MFALLIAIIDDEPAIIEYARLFLEDEGYAVAAWQTEAGALAFHEGRRPDAVVLDLHIEARDAGIRILQSLRADPETASLPVVLSSAQQQFTAEQRARLAGLRYEELPKPYSGGALVSMIEKVIAARP